MYIFINSDINLTKGQCCAQVSHITHLIIDEIIRSAYEEIPTPGYYLTYLEWCAEPITIIKKATTSELVILANVPYAKCFYDDVYDKKTNQKNNYLTTVGFYPGCVDSEKMQNYNLL